MIAPRHPHADVRAGCADVGPVLQPHIRVMLRACRAVRHSENVCGLDGPDVIPNVRRPGSIRQQRGGDTDDKAAKAERIRLGCKVGRHIDVRIPIPSHVVMGKISGNDRDPDIVHIHHRRAHADR